MRKKLKLGGGGTPKAGGKARNFLMFKETQAKLKAYQSLKTKALRKSSECLLSNLLGNRDTRFLL